MANRFPADIVGEQIICRECMCTGPVDASSLPALYQQRKSYIEELTGSTVDYETAGVQEFEQIINIPEDSEVNLWFEYDLFCQVNLWFVLYLLSITAKRKTIKLVLPDDRSPYGYHRYNDNDLKELFNKRHTINADQQIGAIWTAYTLRDPIMMRETGKLLTESNPKLSEAIYLQIERLEPEEDPILTKLRAIVTELNTEDFGSIFRLFQERHLYYGLGDLQMMNLLNRL